MKHIQLAPEHDQVWMVEDFDQGNQCSGNFGELHLVDFMVKCREIYHKMDPMGIDEKPLSPRRFWPFFGISEDREIVLAAVTQNGEALEFAPKWCQDEVKGVGEWVAMSYDLGTPQKVAFIGKEMGAPLFCWLLTY